MFFRKSIKKLVISFLLFPVFHAMSFAEDTTKTKRYGIGGTPIFSYDPDLGLRYGAVINLFDYGKQSAYPDYVHYLYIKAFNSTKGTSHYSAIFESESLIKSSLIFIEASLINDSKLDFFGFNGIKANYAGELIDPEHNSYINKYYYAHKRRLLRIRADLHKTILQSQWKLLLGLSYLNYSIDDIDYEQLKAPSGIDGSEAQNLTLYKQYVNWGIISPDEAGGGQTTNLMTGIAYDTRNNRINCTSGMWFETYLITSFAHKTNEFFGKHILSIRQYHNFNRVKSILTWRLSSQQKVFGEIPGYMLPLYYDTRQDQDGMGGAFTMRGVYRNRLVANGFLSGNIEFRRQILTARIFKLDWSFELSAFADAVYITQEYPLNYSLAPMDAGEIHFNHSSKQEPVFTAGFGLYIIYNKNNITSVNLGWSPDKQFGGTGIYVGSAFLF